MSRGNSSFPELDENGRKWSSYERTLQQTTVEWDPANAGTTPVTVTPIKPDRIHKVKTASGEIIELSQDESEFVLSEEATKRLADRRRKAAKELKEAQQRLANRVPDAHVP
jgi:hypothetical protein